MPIQKKYFFLPVLLTLFSVSSILVSTWPILMREHLHTTEVNWYNKKNKWERFRSPYRHYLVITFTGDTFLDRKKLIFGHDFIRNMMIQKDSVNAIDFHFEDSCRYATFVEAYDICFMEDVHVFIPSDDGLKVLYTTRYEEHRMIKRNLPPSPTFL